MYEEPFQVLSAELALVSPETLAVHYDALLDQWFLMSPAEFRIRLTNRHDDLLQGTARIAARVVVQTFGAMPRTCVLEFTRGDLRFPTLFQGNLALPPGRSAELSRIWLPIATDGHIVFDGLPSTPGNGALLYGPVTCIAWAEAQIFERVQPLRTPDIRFAVVFARF